MTFDNFDFTFDADIMQRDMDRVESKPGQSQSQRSEKYVVLPKGEGATTVRILPADTPSGCTLPYASTRLHYINGRSYHCLRELDGKYWSKGNCPICNYYNFLYQKSKEAATKDDADTITTVAREIKPIERYYYNSIVRDQYNAETKSVADTDPRILAVGKSLHGRVLRACLGNKKFNQAPIGNIMHPINGRDFKIIKEISRSGDREFPNYDNSVFAQEETVLSDDDQMTSWLTSLHDLQAERTNNLKTEEELQHQVDIFIGKVDDDSLGFDPGNLELPSDLKLSIPLKTKTRVRGVDLSTETVKEEPAPMPTPTKAKKAKKEDVPFDIDLNDAPGVEADWVKELQAQINLDD